MHFWQQLRPLVSSLSTHSHLRQCWVAPWLTKSQIKWPARLWAPKQCRSHSHLCCVQGTPLYSSAPQHAGLTPRLTNDAAAAWLSMLHIIGRPPPGLQALDMLQSFAPPLYSGLAANFVADATLAFTMGGNIVVGAVRSFTRLPCSMSVAAAFWRPLGRPPPKWLPRQC